jgi:hypothetical protein
MDSAILAVIIGQVLVLGGLLLSDVLTRRREVELKLSERKQKLYIDLITALIGLAKATKDNASLKAVDADVISRFSSNALLVASDDVYREFQEFQLFTKDHPNDTKGLPYLGRFALALRKDMGNPRSDLSAEEALRTFILAEEWAQLSDLFI